MEFNSQIAWLKSQLAAAQSLLAATGDDLLMRTSLENRIADLREQIAAAPEQAGAARLDVWFSGRAVYGSQGIEQGFMEATSKALVGMINASAREKVRRLKEQRKTAPMPRGRFYVTALTHGSFGYELTYKDNEGMLFDDPAIVESGSTALSLDSRSVDTGFDNICLSDIIEKPEQIVATFQGAFIESGKARIYRRGGQVAPRQYLRRPAGTSS